MRHLSSTKKTIPMIVIVIIIMTVVIMFQTHSVSSSFFSSNQRKQRLEFVHITKTAGSSIEKAATQQGINWGACKFLS